MHARTIHGMCMYFGVAKFWCFTNCQNQISIGFQWDQKFRYLYILSMKFDVKRVMFNLKLLCMSHKLMISPPFPISFPTKFADIRYRIRSTSFNFWVFFRWSWIAKPVCDLIIKCSTKVQRANRVLTAAAAEIITERC